MKPKVYIETSVVSYLTARPTKSIPAAAWQQATVAWWDTRRTMFDLFVSEVVIEEAEQGHPEASQRRLDAMADIPRLAVSEEVFSLAAALIKDGALPGVASDDALHVAVAAWHGMDYLLTWNCRHIDNAEKKPVIRKVCELKGYRCPEICTPLELMGGEL
jgi:predicted nucleic acid-binding protein